MILVDANLLIYAINEDSPYHREAKAWWEASLSGNKVVGIPWVVSLAFLRITTNPRIFPSPLSPEQAIAYMDEWLEHPLAKLVSPSEQHWNILRNLLLSSGMMGNLTTDAHIAALALEQGYTVYSADNDFKRFAGIRHVNPLSLGNSNLVHEETGSYQASSDEEKAWLQSGVDALKNAEKNGYAYTAEEMNNELDQLKETLQKK